MIEMPQEIEGYGECDWPLDPACLTDDWSSYPEPVQNRAKALALSTLRRLTGYRVGGCPVTVRPCSQACFSTMYPEAWTAGRAFTPLNWGGSWLNTCGCYDACGGHLTLKLPLPIGVVYEVLIDGSPFTDFYIANGGLIRTDGEPWPSAQDLALPDTEEGTYSITYLNAWPISGEGSVAAGKLALEFAKACAGATCKLPNTVRSVVRQGVSFEIPVGSFPGGMTGLKDVDAYIAMWNPGGLRERPQIVIPGQRGPQVIR